MIGRCLFFLLAAWTVLCGGTGEPTGLSDLLAPGHGLLDRDGDGYPETISLCIIVPDAPTVHELAAASDIAARVNFESLAVDFSLVRTESEWAAHPSGFPVFIGSNLKGTRKPAGGLPLPPSPAGEEGRVFLVMREGRKGVAVEAGSGKALLETVRAFFLRWPYLWDIWGREEGDTFASIQEDILAYFREQGLSEIAVSIPSVLYAFPSSESPRDPIRRLRFSRGQIKELSVFLDFPSLKERDRAAEALHRLRKHHRRGERTDILSYPGCAEITFLLSHRGRGVSVSLSRMGYPKRMLTPTYKARSRPPTSGKSFDLLSLFTARGFFADGDGDRILDDLESQVIVPAGGPVAGLPLLTSRLMLHTAGASFPVVRLDEEVEASESLKAPILVGRTNRFFRKLVEEGKLKEGILHPEWGRIQVVAGALDKSDTLVVWGGGEKGLRKTLSYLSRTFPYFAAFGEGNPGLEDLSHALDDLLEGGRGGAEAYFWDRLLDFVSDKKEKILSSLDARIYLPRKNRRFTDHVRRYLEENVKSRELSVRSFALREGKKVFEEEKVFPWEGDEALALIRENLPSPGPAQPLLRISVGVSESPEVRKNLKEKIQALLTARGWSGGEVEVLSAYKQGFFWILEKVIPALEPLKPFRLLVRFAEKRDDFSRLKRFYSEPTRWLQELYPVDEIIAARTEIPLERIAFEAKEEGNPVYEVLAYDEGGELLLRDAFSPRTREATYLSLLPEWGTVEVSTGWVTVESGGRTILDTLLPSDLERFWTYYQEEVLRKVYDSILKKTGNRPTFRKQPYFKRLQVEMWFSEPDFPLGLDEEIVSSLEAVHDELYFDTLDFLRGITEVELEEEEIPEDTSRYSAPGNVLPLVHPSLEGKAGRVKVLFEDFQASSPKMVLEWAEEGGRKKEKTFAFPKLKPKSRRFPALVYNGAEERVENLSVELEMEKEKDYLDLVTVFASRRRLEEQHVLRSPFRFPRLHTVTLHIEHGEWEKEEVLTVEPPEDDKSSPFPPKSEADLPVPTDRILSPRMCLELAGLLGKHGLIRSYIAGKSYEGRRIPVLEAFTPMDPYVSLARLITFKPTLFMSGRQHANEVSATNYILKFAELLATDPAYKEFAKKLNVVLHPMENPDGAELAYELQKITPRHSLHAGRYSALGIDVGTQVKASRPLLPEARIRKNLEQRWMPDIYLNLHGYPSHEWVQPFSGYSPYLFRDYWIPRGWFAYFRALTLPLHPEWKEAGEQLKRCIIHELNRDPRIKESNRKFYDRYFRWAARWQPHMDYLEETSGVNLYARRRSSQEARLTPRRRLTYVEETPELMDETARGEWLDFLCTQGLAYLRAHASYLLEAAFPSARIEEENRDRVRIQFFRSRPGKLRTASQHDLPHD